MGKMKNRILAVVSTVALVLTPITAFAGTTSTNTATINITGGSLSVSTPTNVTFAATTLNGQTQTIQAQEPQITCTDATGTGNGWHLSVQASQFTENTPGGGFTGGTTAKTLPTGSLTLNSSGGTITATGGTTSPVPTFKTGAPWTIDSGTSVTIVSAALNQGMGQFNVAFSSTSLSLNLNPATTYVDNTNYNGTSTPYSSTLTWTISSGP